MQENVEKKPNIFGFLKNAFVEQVPDAVPSNGKSTKEVPVTHPFAPTTDGKVDPDPAALEKLETALHQAIPKIYEDFMEKYEGLREIISDENMRFKAALKTSHASAEQIVAALDTLLSVMDHSHDDFTKSFESNKNKVLEQSQQSLNATDELIKTKESQVKSIQEEIVSLHSKRETDAQHLDSEQKRLDGIRLGFEAAQSQIVGRLTAQKTRISSIPRG